MCVHAYGYEYSSAGTHGSQKRACISWSWIFEMWVSYLRWVLATKLRSSGKTVYVLNHQVIFSLFFLFFSFLSALFIKLTKAAPKAHHNGPALQPRPLGGRGRRIARKEFKANLDYTAKPVSSLLPVKIHYFCQLCLSVWTRWRQVPF